MIARKTGFPSEILPPSELEKMRGHWQRTTETATRKRYRTGYGALVTFSRFEVDTEAKRLGWKRPRRNLTPPKPPSAAVLNRLWELLACGLSRAQAVAQVRTEAKNPRALPAQATLAKAAAEVASQMANDSRAFALHATSSTSTRPRSAFTAPEKGVSSDKCKVGQFNTENGQNSDQMPEGR